MARVYHPVPIEHVNREKFWRWVNKTTSCWLWTRRGGTGSASAYGLFDIQVPTDWGSATLRQSAHRVAYAITKSQIPNNLEVMHLCNTPRCVNPEHLELGTPADNSAYKVLHGRQARGSRTAGGGGRSTRPWRRLTETEVVEIRSRHSERREHYSSLAKQYGVHWKTVSAIVNGTPRKQTTTIPPYVSAQYKSGLSLEKIKTLKHTPLKGSSLTELADAFGVSKPAILHVVHRATWKHVP